MVKIPWLVNIERLPPTPHPATPLSHSAFQTYYTRAKPCRDGWCRAPFHGPRDPFGHQLRCHRHPVRHLQAQVPSGSQPEGVVQSVKETLSSQFVENCRGVVQRLTLQEHKMVWNRTTHLWSNQEKIIHQRTNATPFGLVPQDGQADPTVRVMRPLEAAELSLETVYEKFHPSVQSFTDAIGHYISGERPKGLRETEEMLRVGTVLTGVGELVLDSHQAIKLQPPKEGMRYYLSALDFDALLRKHEASVRLWRVLTVVFGLASCAVLFLILYKQYRRHLERQRPRQMQETMAAGDDAASTCIICMSGHRSCVFLECGHVCSCDKCYQALPSPPLCPLCRQEIIRVVPLYNS
ncbi:hypothetical protein JRQ81_009921 [Phrynocephalus forsythii]|uniref:RING-type E3 ubiquitin transferase n=1 Tax=Phrynocephalus forsythii TaxID=171643 RepID=A0A9Q0X949_9SAUR|nr:hypothetical protein JRQ81_009921 [Phrynocephalus forsythii]